VSSTDNLAAVLEARAAERGWAGDVAFLVGRRAFTHGDVHDGAARAAALLGAAGVGRGDRVLVALADGIEFAWAFLGAVRLGAVAVPVNPRLTPSDHRAAAVVVDAAVVVCGADLADRFQGWPVVVADGLEAALAAHPPLPPADVDPGDGAYALFTSGTTGVPKAALHAHRDPAAHFDAFAPPALAISGGDVVLSVSKLYFAYGLGNSLFFPLLAGCRAVLHADHPRADDIAALVRRHGVTILFSVPTFYARLVAAGRGDAWASLRVAVSAGEALGPTLAERAEALLGCPVLDGLGSTEVGQTFASNTLDRMRAGTVGRALAPYRVEVRDRAGRTVAAGETGDLWVAGPTLLLGYLAGADLLARDGEWLRTGDRARLDEDGFLHLQGRADDVEQVGGISVSPLEIEAVLGRHPAVTEVAVAAVVGGDGASRLEAFVVAAAGAAAGDVVGAELLARARAELAPFKVPRSVSFVTDLPRTPTGKLRRFVLRTGAWGTGGIGAPAEESEDGGPADQPAARVPNRSV
jgi:fatty-acyl-CoA synthase/benzoate-CoA ligase/fatty acid CoA ligase FadD22